MVIKTASRDVSADFTKFLWQEQNAHEIIWVTFPPNAGSNAWLFIRDDGAPFSRNCQACHDKIDTIRAAGGRVLQAAFTAQGGWAVVDNKGKVTMSPSGLPSAFIQKVNEFASAHTGISSIAFMTQGEGWCIVTEFGQLFQEWIPWKCVDWINERFKAGIKVRSVALGPVHDQWITFDNHDVWNSQNQDEELNMWIGYYNQVYGPVQWVAYDPDSHGWSMGARVIKYEKIYDSVWDTHVAPLDVYENVQAILNDKVVGYGCTIGADGTPGAFTGGLARTSADAPAKKFVLSTKTVIASCSKVLTALAAIRVLGNRMDDTIENYMPIGWNLDPYVKAITFRQLLSHTAGIAEFNGTHSFDDQKEFFTLNVAANTPKRWDPSKKNIRNYSNRNFGIFKILLPIVAGTLTRKDDNDYWFADEFNKLVQKHVFDPIGCPGIDHKPPENAPQSEGYAYDYQTPPNSGQGHHFPDGYQEIAAGGFYLTIEEVRKLLHSYAISDGKVIDSNQIGPMINFGKPPVGWDTNTNSGGIRWIQKNGGGGQYSGSIALFGNGLFGALFLNSPLRVPPNYQSQWNWCNQCQTLIFTGRGLGACPAASGGSHNTAGTRIYYIPGFNVTPAGAQPGWKWCNRCQGLCFTINNPNSAPCGAGGFHNFQGSDGYSLSPTTIMNWGQVDPLYQAGWQYCNKCEQLAINAGKAAPAKTCAAGGQHSFVKSGPYMLRMANGADEVLYSAYIRAIKIGK